MSEQNQTEKALVCVKSITYNQAPYIEDTMNGFCMQETDFPFVCTIIDDASTDGEQDVIRRYLRDHFDMEDQDVVRNEETDDYILTYARHKENQNCFFAVLYLKYNHYSVGKGRRKNGYIKEWLDGAKYVALCEGDDYWIDPNKLQKQVNYLESHPECGMVYTQVSQLIQDSGRIIKGWAAQTDFDDLLLNANKIITLATVIRADLYNQFSKDIGYNHKWLMGDFPLWLFISHQSDIKYIDDTTGVYRILSTSASHNADIKVMRKFLVSTYDVRCHFAKKYGRESVLNLLAQKEVDNLLRLSVQKNSNISLYIYQFAKEHKVLSIKILLKCLLYSNKIGRKLHKKRNPSNDNM